MLTSTVTLCLGILFFTCGLTWIVRKKKKELQNYKGLWINFFPLLVALILLLLGNYLFHERSGIRIKYTWTMAVSTACYFLMIPALFWGKPRSIIAGFMCAALSIFLIGDLVYVRFFGNISPVLSLTSSGQLWDIRDSILATIEPQDWVYLILALSGLSMGLF